MCHSVRPAGRGEYVSCSARWSHGGTQSLPMIRAIIEQWLHIAHLHAPLLMKRKVYDKQRQVSDVKGGSLNVDTQTYVFRDGGGSRRDATTL